MLVILPKFRQLFPEIFTIQTRAVTYKHSNGTGRHYSNQEKPQPGLFYYPKSARDRVSAINFSPNSNQIKSEEMR